MVEHDAPGGGERPLGLAMVAAGCGYSTGPSGLAAECYRLADLEGLAGLSPRLADAAAARAGPILHPALGLSMGLNGASRR
jgi:hypothetical protein